MPEHLHGIILLTGNSVGATLAVARNDRRAGTRPAPTVGDIVGSFKSLCYRDWKRHIGKMKLSLPAKIWQRNYYEHVIRDEDELRKVREYIRNNELGISGLNQ